MDKPAVTKLFRCAIYTRKSTEHNLDLEFNSLHAQREACEAYIKSQAHEGWRLVPHRFDDGAFSGASLERPALQELLTEVRAGKVDVIVVYKVDRLTRSLSDFAKLVELFDQHSVSFVSVTQSFNTTTSMGRLTLNVLLSFAQFEREVIGERVRDKIAASKAKGLWVGGSIPLGYASISKKLVVVPKEAGILLQARPRKRCAASPPSGARPSQSAAGVISMRGDPNVIEYLNKGLRSELTAMNQYWLHYRLLDNWGYKTLAKKWREESTEEMQHADKLIVRIIFLDGMPNMQVLDPLHIGQNVKEVLDYDLQLEMTARGLYEEAATHCHSVKDYVSRDLFEALMHDEEEHIDFLETQLDLVAKLGLELYAQHHIGEPDEG